MKYQALKHTSYEASNIVMGNMRLTELSLNNAEKLIRTAMEEGINFFDHADIYGEYPGKSEEWFSKAIKMNATIRDKMILQSKCGIRPEGGYFDFSKEHIINSVDGILKRLDTDYLDILLLHRPDPLIEPEEVADTFEQLRQSGKVKHFGVSNHSPAQIELLQRAMPQKLVVNQMQFSIAHTPMIDSGLTLNMHTDQSDRKSVV